MNKEEKKYYLPTIEEFHIGFEYEYLCCENIHHPQHWFTTTFEGITEYADLTNNTLLDIKELIEWKSGSEIRVKYLDKEDIEEVFGPCSVIRKYNNYTKQEYIYDEYYNLEIKSGVIGQDKLIYRLRYDEFNQDLIIEKSDWDLNFHQNFVFIGTIKNKSELKRLLKQLNIK